MKKSRKLVLSRETLHSLELRGVAGGASLAVCTTLQGTTSNTNTSNTGTYTTGYDTYAYCTTGGACSVGEPCSGGGSCGDCND